MIKIKKPELSQNARELGNKLFKYLFMQDSPVDKKTMCKYMGWEYNSSNDRKLRIVLANIAKVKPLISTSDNRGYYLAKTKDDLEKVEHQQAELDSRIEELNERKKPLIAFYDKYHYKS